MEEIHCKKKGDWKADLATRGTGFTGWLAEDFPQ
jgi:hypothetical protein